MNVLSKMAEDIHKQGQMPCDCGEYTYVFKASVLAQLPKNYAGEICGECNSYMCALDKLVGRDAGESASCGSDAGQA